MEMNEAAGDEPMEIETPINNEKCYFSEPKSNPQEFHPRPDRSKTKKSCRGKLVRFGYFFLLLLFSFDELIKNDHGELYGSQNEADLASARGYGEFRDWTEPTTIREFSSKFICNAHRLELTKSWHQHMCCHFLFDRSNGKKRCSLPEEINSLFIRTLRLLNTKY